MSEETQPPNSSPVRDKLTPFHWLDFLLGLVGGMISNVLFFGLLSRLVYFDPCSQPNDIIDFILVGVAALLSQICAWLCRRKSSFAYVWGVSSGMMSVVLLILVFCEGMAVATLPIPHACSGD